MFWVGPVIAAILLSFAEWTLSASPEWVGLRNYEGLSADPLFWTSLRNTTVYTLGVIPLQMVLSLLIALALNRKIRFRALFRTLYFLPTVTSIVAMALVWRALFDYRFGFLNGALGLIGVDAVPWLLEPGLAMFAVILMSAWQGIGFPIILWLAGLQSIPEEYLEAARVDGANAWARFRYVTLPLLAPTTFFILVISFISSFQVFEQTYVMTSGGPERGTYTLVNYIYEEAFTKFSMGPASAMGCVLAVIILCVTLIQLRLQRRWVHYET